MEHTHRMLYDDIGSIEESVSCASTTNSCNSSWKLLPPHQVYESRYMVSPGLTVALDSSSGQLDVTRKRKAGFFSGSSDGDVDDCDLVPTKSYGSKKQNHSEIEKRRRNKMNTYITELSLLVPMCTALGRKLDKLTVLRMAVQHMKTLRGSLPPFNEIHYKPAFLSDDDLKRVILEAAEGFLFVIGCDRGRILYVSQSVSQILNYAPSDLLGQSWFDILHPKDIAKVKEQLSASDLTPREKLFDAKTMLPIKTDVLSHGHSGRLCSGARRSFFCRMKCKVQALILKEEADTTTGCQRQRQTQTSDRKYSVVHCTGYLRSWTPDKLNLEEENDNGHCSGAEGTTGVGQPALSLSCLVAVGRTVPTQIPTAVVPRVQSRPLEFTSRHNSDGKFIYVDPRATLILGYLPQEMLGTSCYEYYHQEDIASLAECHKAVLQVPNSLTTTSVYRFRAKDGSYKWLQTNWKPFHNPWTKDIEYLIAFNAFVTSDVTIVESTIPTLDDPAPIDGVTGIEALLQDIPSAEGTSMQQYFSTSGIGAGKIGRQIADEALDVLCLGNGTGSSKRAFTTELDQTNPVAATACLAPSSDPVLPLSGGHHDNVAKRADASTTSGTRVAQSTDNAIMESLFEGGETLHASSQSSSTEGNDDAAMAVIMSLLEADAGLGGPVDFSGLPWPLP